MHEITGGVSFRHTLAVVAGEFGMRNECGRHVKISFDPVACISTSSQTLIRPGSPRRIVAFPNLQSRIFRCPPRQAGRKPFDRR